MSVTLHISSIDVTTIRHDYSMVRIHLQNSGTECVGPGTVIAWHTLQDGTVQSIEFQSTISLFPGEHTKVSQLLQGAIKVIDFKFYYTNEGIGVPLTGNDDRAFLRWAPAA